MFTCIFTPLVFKLLGPICFLICLADPFHDFSSQNSYDGPFRCFTYKDAPYSVREFFNWTLPYCISLFWICVMVYKAFTAW